MVVRKLSQVRQALGWGQVWPSMVTAQVTAGSVDATGKGPELAVPDSSPRARPGEEVLALRSQRSRTYAGKDGSLVARISAVNYRSGDEWKAISNQLVASDQPGYGWENAASARAGIAPAAPR